MKTKKKCPFEFDPLQPVELVYRLPNDKKPRSIWFETYQQAKVYASMLKDTQYIHYNAIIL